MHGATIQGMTFKGPRKPIDEGNIDRQPKEKTRVRDIDNEPEMKTKDNNTTPKSKENSGKGTEDRRNTLRSEYRWNIKIEEYTLLEKMCRINPPDDDIREDRH